MSAELAFNRSVDVDYGVAEEVAPGVRRIVANNPGPYTFLGTNTYVVGTGQVAVIDPGPADTTHLKAIAAAIKGERLTHILITHSHRDHCDGARALQALLGGEIASFGPTGERARRGHAGAELRFRRSVLRARPHAWRRRHGAGHELRARRAAPAGPRARPSLLRAGRQAHRVHRRSRDGMEHDGDRPAGGQHGGLSRLARKADAAPRQDVPARVMAGASRRRNAWSRPTSCTANGASRPSSPASMRGSAPSRASSRGSTARSMPG